MQDRFSGVYAMLSRTPARARDSAAYVPPGASVEAATEAVVVAGRKRLAGRRPAGVLSLSRADIDLLWAGRAESDEIVISPATLRGLSRRGGGPALERQSPADICRHETLPEDRCGEILGEPPPPDDATGDSTGEGPPVSGDAEDVVRESVRRLVVRLAAPEELSAGAARRPTADDVRAHVKGLLISSGPADAPATYDFHSLRIAFAHVWQEAFDAGVVPGCRRTHNAASVAM
jgi:hypothetical protein